MSQSNTTSFSSPIDGAELLRNWELLPRSERYRALGLWANVVANAYTSGRDVSALSPFQSRFTLISRAMNIDVWPPSTGPAKRPIIALRHALDEWAQMVNHILSPPEMLFFLRKLARRTGLPPHQGDVMGWSIVEERKWNTAIYARLHYQNYLANRHREKSFRGTWLGEPMPLATLYKRICEAESNPETRWLHRGPEASVFVTTIGDRSIAVKHYTTERMGRRLKSLLRPARNRRNYAAARTLTDLGIGTPMPYGFLDARTSKGVERYYFSEHVETSITVRDWIKPRMHLQDAAFRKEAADRLARFMVSLYPCGIFHEDTKGGNMLVDLDERGMAVRFAWIDCEAMRFGLPPFRRHILRNLIQLNGSIGTRISREDRLYFLNRMAETHPWLKKTAIAPLIERATAQRLRREIMRQNGH